MVSSRCKIIHIDKPASISAGLDFGQETNSQQKIPCTPQNDIVWGRVNHDASQRPKNYCPVCERNVC
jgi:hypothetical protein